MSLSVAIQMDPIQSIDIDADSTFVLALEAARRGYQLFHYAPQALTFNDGLIQARAQTLKLRPVHGDHYELGQPRRVDLAEFDVVLMRQDPPFDLAYITATHFLEKIHPKTLVVNDPGQVRNAPEKLFLTQFPEVTAPTVMTSDKEVIIDFRKTHGDIVIKPLYGNGGAGVFHLAPEDDNLNSLLEMFAGISNEPLIIQAYLPEVRRGDKRIILVDGVPVGAVNRVPAAGEARSNMHVGGRAEPSRLSARDHEICAAIGPALKERGLIFAGIDVIGAHLTEINVTSPTGLQEINRFDDTALEALIWDAIEARL